MINLLIGPPGGGKSYEATVYHVLPALSQGRKVITNLPLNVDRLAIFEPDAARLVQIVTESKGPRGKDGAKARPFSVVEDYGDPWRHPVSGAGPLYVIDECHLAMPRGATQIAVEEWFSLHRHESADVLLITQSYGKVSKAVIDLVQVCYRVKKAVLFGSAKKYVRKVQDGVRGEVISTGFRTYEKRYFGLYVSHTKGGGAELEASDISPLWKRWPFLLAPVLVVGGCVGLGASLSQGNPLAPKSQPKAAQSVLEAPVVVLDERPRGEPQPDGESAVDVGGEPFAGLSVHVVGFASMGARTHYALALARGGVIVASVDQAELLQAGYAIRPISDCAMGYTYPGKGERIAVCDRASFGVKGALSS